MTKIVQACPAIYLAAAEDRASSGRPLAFIRLSRADSSIEDKALGRRFVQTVETTALEIQADPMRWRVFEGRVRRCLVPRFPDIIDSLVEDEVLYFGALLHGARHPEAYRGSFTDL